MKPIIREENKIFVGGIHIAVEEPELATFFSQFGEVAECVLMRDRETGRSRGFGFVTFAEHSSLQAAAKHQFLEYQGRKMEIKLAVPKGRNMPSQATVMPNMDPAQYAAMQEYYKAYAASNGSSSMLQMPSASMSSDPKAYMDAMIAAYTAAYGPEMAAAAAAYYAPYLNTSIPKSASDTQEQSTTSNISPNVDTASASDRSKITRQRSPRRSSSRSRSRSRSPYDRYSRNGGRRRRDDSRDRYHRRGRSSSRSSSPPPPPPPRRDRSPDSYDRRPSTRRH